MSTWLLYGFTTDRNGTVDYFQMLDLDSDLRGIEQPAHLDYKSSTLVVRNGMNTYVGKLSPSSPPSGRDGYVSMLWNGMFYHDNTGSVDGNVPRGTFNIRVVEQVVRSDAAMRVTPAVTYVLNGSITTHNHIGQLCTLAVGFSSPLERSDDNPCAFKRPLPVCVTHHTIFSDDKRGEELTIYELGSHDDTARVTVEAFTGTWVETSESFKFCGLYRRFFAAQDNIAKALGGALDEGTFFFTIDQQSDKDSM